ncbi:ABC transporter permease [Streptomyces sp. NPDC055078]
MLAYLIKRIAGAVMVLFVVSVITFSLTALIPGDPAMSIAGENASREEIAQVRTQLGLDDPVVERYFDWVGGVVQGDLGTSLFNAQPVSEILATRLPVTLSLAGAAMLIAVLIAVPCGVASALRPGSLLDRGVSWFTALAIATPSFWLGLLLILLLALTFPVLPATGYEPLAAGVGPWAYHLFLPALTLGVAAAVEPTRQLRASLAQTMGTDYIRTARAKGMLPGTVLRKHALRNAAMPCVTVLGLEAGQLLGGAVIVETVFGLPGVGTLAEITVTRQDLPVLQGIVLVSALVVVVVNLATDLLQRGLTPGARA